ncbi:MAG TPA: 2-oxoglutarate dehydrogenase E1 component, partial [Gammaproteobacteria bacterium]|nr:2-oxoglutarate dehydrogenase E1 component [Gammaproteobacteria bacterium]
MNDSIENRYRSSPFSGGNAAFLDELYEQYLQDPDSLTPVWREYFSGFEAASPGQRDIPHGPVIAQLKSQAHQRRSAAPVESGSKSEFSPEMADKQAAVMRLIEAYRGRGHLVANLDPLGLQGQNPFIPQPVDDLDPAFHGLTEADMDTEFSTKTLVGANRMALRDIVAMLKKVYCGSIGFEYMHVTTATERRWLKEHIESTRATPALKQEEKLTILEQLSAAEGLEKYLHTRYVGQKRFSLEGGETMIPMLRDLVQRGGESGLQEFVVGMAHRGRLNVLVNVLGKSPKELFSEFEGVYNAKVENRSGDVKYHLGFSSDI